MSLDWNLSQCRDVEELKSDKEWPVTKALIFETMAVGFGAITETNAAEFHRRSCFVARLFGDPPFSLEQVQRRIGLTTNVETRSRAVWLERVYNTAIEVMARDR